MTRSTRTLRYALTLGALLAALLPVRASAQAPTPTWRLEPTVGALIDEYDAGDDGSRTGTLVGLEVSRAIAGPLRGVASLGYARVGDVAIHPLGGGERHVLGNEWVFAAIGPELDVPVSRATLSLAFQAGAAWRRMPVTGSVGNPAPDPWIERDDFSARSMVVPGASLRYPLGNRIAVSAGARAYVMSPLESARISPAFSVGVAFVR